MLLIEHTNVVPFDQVMITKSRCGIINCFCFILKWFLLGNISNTWSIAVYCIQPIGCMMLIIHHAVDTTHRCSSLFPNQVFYCIVFGSFETGKTSLYAIL
ncbi:hypothetical protein ACP275_14G310000 [Erythranthe tilingii]